MTTPQLIDRVVCDLVDHFGESGLTSAILPPLLQHAAVLTRVVCWMMVAHFQTRGSTALA